MSKIITCDKCKQEIDRTGFEITSSFNRDKYDLCQRCYTLFKKFIHEAPME